MSQSSYSYFIPNCFHQLMEIIRIMRIYADLVAVVLLTAGQERCLRNLLHCNGLLKNSAVVMPNDTAIIRPLTPSSASMFLITWYLCTSLIYHAWLPMDEFCVELFPPKWRKYLFSVIGTGYCKFKFSFKKKILSSGRWHPQPLCCHNMIIVAHLGFTSFLSSSFLAINLNVWSD